MIPKRFELPVFAFFMSTLMSCLMSGVITFLNLGMVEGFFTLWMSAFAKAFLVAYPSILLVVPVVRRIVSRLVAAQ